MTSEQRFQGYNLERNSSKVMAPPGGVSSISFGGYEAPPPARKPAKPATPPAAAAPAAAAPAAAAAAAPAPAAAPAAAARAPAAAPWATDAGPAVPAGQRVNQVDRFEKAHSTSACQVSRNQSSVFTAENNNNRRKLHNPPGGASSITFG